MRRRGLGLVASLLALGGLGAAAGVGLARYGEDGPRRLTGTAPVAAASPSVPTTPPVPVKPDPRTPPLEPGHPTHGETVGQDPFALTLPVPDGWLRSNSRQGVWVWAVPDNPPNTYAMRVTLPSGFTTVTDALAERVAALESASGIEEFTVETQTASTLVASYVLDGYRRVAVERFLSLGEDGGAVYAVVALVGREVDRDGMTSLLERITTRARR